MPELPEVEVVKRSLKKKIQNFLIRKVRVNDGKLRYPVTNKDMSRIAGLKIKTIKRRSKYLLIFFNKPIVMLTHLGMTGKFFFIKNKRKFRTSFYYELNNKKDNKHDRIIFYLSNKQKLVYNDIRKFGFIKLLDLKNYHKNSHIKSLGPEPLSKKFHFNYFKKYTKNKKRNIKSILMDQKFIAGLGNIYVNEILFLSKVHPRRAVKNLKNFEIKKIIKITKKILTFSIKSGGSSIKDFSSIDGIKGFFQEKFNVYGKSGSICSNTDCNKKIIRLVISNRASFYCSDCQK